MRGETDLHVSKSLGVQTRLGSHLTSNSQENVVSVTFGREGEKVVISGIQTANPDDTGEMNEDEERRAA